MPKLRSNIQFTPRQSLSGLRDVDDDAITDGQGLAWNETTQLYEPVTLGAGGGSLDGGTPSTVFGDGNLDLGAPS